MAGINRTVAPNLEPVTLTEFKNQLRILTNHEDTLLETYISTARERCEEYLGQAFVNQTWELSIDRWPCSSIANSYSAIEFPRPPLQSVSSVQYRASTGTLTTLSSTGYQVDIKNKPGRVAPAANGSWPTLGSGYLNSIVVTAVCGYGGASATDAQSVAAVPYRIKQAIMVYAGVMYRNRDLETPMPPEAQHLLDLCHFGNYRYVSADAY